MENISPLLQSEIPEAATVIATVFAEKYRQKAIDEFLRLFAGERHPTYVFAARRDGKIIGISACLETYFAMQAYGICWVAVLEEYRNQKVGTQLIRHAEQFIINDLLQGQPGTIILSADKIEYYQKLGYALQPTLMHDKSQIMMKTVSASNKN